MAQLTVEQMLQSAARHHQAGRLVEAEKIYRRILARQPKHVDTLHLLGVLSGQVGNVNAAINLIGRAIELKPDNPQALCHLGNILLEKGQLDRAITTYHRAIELSPDFIEPYERLGAAQQVRGRFEEAITAYSKAIRLKPNATLYLGLGEALAAYGRFDEAAAAYIRSVELKPDKAQAHSRLGVTLAQLGRFEEALLSHDRALALAPNDAVAFEAIGQTWLLKQDTPAAVNCLRKAIALAPQMPTAWNFLGTALQSAGQIDEASTCFIRALTLSPNLADAQQNLIALHGEAVAFFKLGKAFSDKGRFEEGVAAFARAVEANPDYFEAYCSRSVVLSELSHFDEAMRSHGCAAALRPDDPLTHHSLGIILTLKKEMPAAAESFRRALAKLPDFAAAWNGLGTVLKALGQFDEAAGCLRRALEIVPGSALIHGNLATTARNTGDKAELERLSALLSQPRLSVDDRISASFALAKLLDDADQYDEAFEHYAQANSLKKQSCAEKGERFVIGDIRICADQFIQTFTPQFFADRRGWGESSELPVFIVGMPRSGTTLVEQIAASHPDIFGAGERQDIHPISVALGGDNHAAIQRWNSESVTNAAKTQVDLLRALGGTALRVIDKMPDNVFQLGLISLLFPSARVIFCRRDARDNCLSCYFQGFAKSNNLWSYDLVDCGRRFLEIDRLTTHWLSVLPLKMLEVQYEELVADLEGQSRRLIDFLGLPWDPACLEFHKTQRTVVTASIWQVRQPIYTRSVGRWRNYEKHLGSLLEVLGKGS